MCIVGPNHIITYSWLLLYIYILYIYKQILYTYILYIYCIYYIYISADPGRRKGERIGAERLWTQPQPQQQQQQQQQRQRQQQQQDEEQAQAQKCDKKMCGTVRWLQAAA